MAYLGKTFKWERDENFENFIAFLATRENSAHKFAQFKPKHTLTKSGDGYVMTLADGDFKKEIAFKPGVPFQETMSNGLTATSTVTVDGDTFTQVQDFGDKGSITFRREFSPNQLVVKITGSKWDGDAIRYYALA